MRARIILSATVALLMFVFVSCIASEVFWANKQESYDPTRELVGLPSIAIGNLNPSARNPGLEILCTGLFDVPGGYCSYFTPGVSVVFPLGANITAIEETR